MKKLMRNTLPVALALAVLFVLGGCFDAEPGEISMQMSVAGESRNATVMVYNGAGKQIQEIAGDQSGVVYIKDLPPGKYTIKFKGHDNQMYPAVREAEVTPGGNVFLKVDLTQAADPGTGGA